MGNKLFVCWMLFVGSCRLFGMDELQSDERSNFNHVKHKHEKRSSFLVTISDSPVGQRPLADGIEMRTVSPRFLKENKDLVTLHVDVPDLSLLPVGMIKSIQENIVRKLMTLTFGSYNENAAFVDALRNIIGDKIEGLKRRSPTSSRSGSIGSSSSHSSSSRDSGCATTTTTTIGRSNQNEAMNLAAVEDSILQHIASTQSLEKKQLRAWVGSQIENNARALLERNYLLQGQLTSAQEQLKSAKEQIKTENRQKKVILGVIGFSAVVGLVTAVLNVYFTSRAHQS